MRRSLPALLLLLLPVLGGCRYTITPPESVVDPVTVYLVDYGDTGRVWLPVPEQPGTFREWGYGDWRWYANDRQSLLYGAVVFVWPTAGTIGRHDWAGSPWGESGERREIREEIAGYATWVYEVDVERRLAEVLLADLDERFESRGETELFNERRKMSFVKDDSSYWLGHQSSSVAAEWMRALGCEARGFTLKARYGVRGSGRAFDVRGDATSDQ